MTPDEQESYINKLVSMEEEIAIPLSEILADADARRASQAFGMTEEQYEREIMSLSPSELAEKFIIVPHSIIDGSSYQERQAPPGMFNNVMWVGIYEISVVNGIRQAIKVSNFLLKDRPFLLKTPERSYFFRGAGDLMRFRIGDYAFMAAGGDFNPGHVWREWAPATLLQPDGYTGLDNQIQTEVIHDEQGYVIGARELTEERKLEILREQEKRNHMNLVKQRLRKLIAARTTRIAKEKEARAAIERAEKVPRLIRALTESAERIYPGLVDIQHGISKVITVKVHFPEFEIINSKGGSHKIFDLFVNIKVSEDGKMADSSLVGERATFNYAEYCSTYVHSHLPGEAIRNAQAFCLNGNNLQTLFTDLRKDSFFESPERWIRVFEGILFQLESYVSWESLEGSCFRHIQNIAVKKTADIDVTAEAARMFKKLSPDDAPPLTYVKGIGFQVSSNSEVFEEWLVKYATHKQYKNDRGEYYNDTKEGIPAVNFTVPESQPIKFKGKEIIRTVRVDFYHENKEQRKEYCHGQVKGAFVQLLNKRLERAFAERNLRTVFRDVLSRKKQATDAYRIGRTGKTQRELESFLKTFTPVSNVS